MHTKRYVVFILEHLENTKQGFAISLFSRTMRLTSDPEKGREELRSVSTTLQNFDYQELFLETTPHWIAGVIIPYLRNTSQDTCRVNTVLNDTIWVTMNVQIRDLYDRRT